MREECIVEGHGRIAAGDLQRGLITMKNKTRILGFIFGVVAVGLIVGPLLILNGPKPYRHPQFSAAPYEPPVGCVVRKYTNLDPISLACADAKYIFDDWRAFGLEWPGRPGVQDNRKVGTYYRVGNDLVGFQCTVDQCFVKGVERSVFVNKVDLSRGEK